MTASTASASRTLAAAASVLVLVLLSVLPAAAQELTPTGSRLAIDIERLHAIVTPEQDLRIHARVANRGSADRDDLRIVMTVHQQPIGRFYYQQAMDRGELGAVIHGLAIEVGDVPAQGARSVEIAQSAEDLGLARPAGQDGVYPVRLQLQAGGDVLDEVTTNLVFTAPSVERPVAVSVLLPLTHSPSRDGQGVFTDTSLAEQIAPDGPLGALVARLADEPAFPVALAVDGLMLEEVSDLASGYLIAAENGPQARSADTPEALDATAFTDDLRTIAERQSTRVVALPYAAADLVALQRHGLGRELERHLFDGARSVAAATGAEPVMRVLWPPAGIDVPTMRHASDLGVRWFVLSEGDLARAGPPDNESPRPVRQLADAGPTTRALVPDPWLEETLVRRHLPPVLHAQRILGEVATVYFERPAIGDRGLLLAPPQAEALHPLVVEALAAGLEQAAFADLVTLGVLASRVTPPETPVRLHYPASARADELSAGYLAELDRARAALGSLDGVLVEDRATAAHFDRLLLQAASTSYREDPAAGLALAEAITSTVERLYSSVQIPEVPPITLTSIEGQVPITIRSHADVALRVQLHLRTPSYEIAGGETRELILEPGQSEVHTFQVRALRPGRTDGIHVLITDAEGLVELTEATVVVRSAAFSVTGLVVTAGAAVFLAGWGVRGVARRKRAGSRPRHPRARPARRIVERSLARRT